MSAESGSASTSGTQSISKAGRKVSFSENDMQVTRAGEKTGSSTARLNSHSRTCDMTHVHVNVKQSATCRHQCACECEAVGHLLPPLCMLQCMAMRVGEAAKCSRYLADHNHPRGLLQCRTRLVRKMLCVGVRPRYVSLLLHPERHR